MKLKKWFWILIPYLVSFVGAGAFYILAAIVNGPLLQAFLINISASLASITLIYLFYQLLKSKSEKRLKKSVTFYASNKLSNDILSILSTLFKLIYGLEANPTVGQVLDLKKLSYDEVTKLIENKEILGFQRLKIWDDSRTYFKNILENNLILKSFDDEQLEALINIERSLIYLSFGLKREEHFSFTGKESEKYQIMEGQEKTSLERFKPTAKYLLLEKLSGHKGIVKDFGEFEIPDTENLLKIYKTKPEDVDGVGVVIYKVLSALNRWEKLTA